MPVTTTTTPYPALSSGYYSVRVEFYQPTNITSYQGKAYYRLAARAIDSSNMVKEIFVHQRKPTGNVAKPYIDEFVSVASPHDITMLSTTVPDSRGFIRKDECDILLTTSEHYAQTAALLKSGVQGLCDAYKQLDELKLSESYVGQAIKPYTP